MHGQTLVLDSIVLKMAAETQIGPQCSAVVVKSWLVSPSRQDAGCIFWGNMDGSVVRWSGSGGGSALRKCFSVSGVLCVNY